MKNTVERIFSALKRLEFHLHDRYPDLPVSLPHSITFIHAQDALDRYPSRTSKEREDLLAEEYGAVFLIGIGAKLSDGAAHDGRAPDYDDWSTQTSPGYRGLNGDILLWNETLGRSLELSSMGIRVDPEALRAQLALSGQEGRKNLYFHRQLLEGKLPLCIGGGIGQSRLCMHFLRKAHIGEIQVGLWPKSMREDCERRGIPLL